MGVDVTSPPIFLNSGSLVHFNGLNSNPYLETYRMIREEYFTEQQTIKIEVSWAKMAARRRS